MLIRITSSLFKNSRLTLKYVPAMFQSTNIKVINNQPKFEPSGHVPDSEAYLNIPVNINGKDILIKNEILNKCYPFVPTIQEDSNELDNQEKLNLEEEKKKSLEDELCVWFGDKMPTILDDKKSERDLVNYPRINYRLWNIPKTRYFLIPDSYFKFFESKTGITGGYLFGLTLSTFLISKEYVVLGEDAYNVIVFATLSAILVKKLSFFNNNLTGTLLKETQGWTDWKFGMIDFLKKYINNYEKNKKNSLEQSLLFKAKRENVLLQREIEYRNRLKKVFDEVKKKLDYQVAIDEAQKQFKQKHLVKWVIENVNNSIDSNIEKLVLQKCISDLNTLSQKRKNAI